MNRREPRSPYSADESIAFRDDGQASSSISKHLESNQGGNFRDLQREWQERTRELILQSSDQLLWRATAITGEPDSAVDCLLEAADGVSKRNRLFPGPVMPVAKLSIIRAAIRKIRPCLSAFAHQHHTIRRRADMEVDGVALPTPEMASSLLERFSHTDLLPVLLELDCLHRTVYLLLVLERWTRVEAAKSCGFQKAE